MPDPVASVAASSAVSSSRTRDMVTASLLASLMAATSWVSGVLQPVPFSLQSLFVVLAALLLPPAWAAAAMGAYVLLGVIGLPVFAQGGSGVGILAGPTGGYLIGFILAAAIGSGIRRLISRSGRESLLGDSAAATVASLAVYAVGVPWLAASAHLPVGAAVAGGMLPFMVGDAAKAFAAVGLATAIRRARRH